MSSSPVSVCLRWLQCVHAATDVVDRVGSSACEWNVVVRLCSIALSAAVVTPAARPFKQRRPLGVTEASVALVVDVRRSGPCTDVGPVKLADRYEGLARIGDGGMADVFRAHDRTLDREVALKVLRPSLVDDAEFMERFRREAEAVGPIVHPNIVRVLDWGTSDDGPFIAMELVPGGTLRGLMRTRGRLDERAAADVAAQIADGLEAAHLRGVLHRDLKPDNILLDENGRPKLADFGIARLAAATALTRTGELLGTPRYLAPEQMTGEVVDERVDVYALGVILYEMLSGMTPTGGATPSEIVSRRLRSDPLPLHRLAPVTFALEAIVMRAIARDPDRRYARAAALATALRSFLSRPAPVAAPRPSRRVLPVAPIAALLGVLTAVAGATAIIAGAPGPAMGPARSAAPAAVATLAPAASTAPVPSPEPRPIPPSPTPAPTERPTSPPTAAPTVAGFSQAAPAEAVAAFYGFVSKHDYPSAAALWSPRMQATYPPATNIWGRFDRTSQIYARSVRVTNIAGPRAALAVDIVETLDNGTVRRYVGTWYLINNGGRWLLDQPVLGPA